MKIWLNSLGLGQYYDQLQASGFTSLARCSALSLQALESVDFNLPGHKKRLFKAGMTCAQLRIKDLSWQSHQWLVNCVYVSWSSFSFTLFGPPEYRIDAVWKSVVYINEFVFACYQPWVILQRKPTISCQQCSRGKLVIEIRARLANTFDADSSFSCFSNHVS